MARIRSIKPEFWQDELIQTLHPLARLLFLGLVSHADDSGRFRSNPLFVRAQVFPYDSDVDVEALLEVLDSKGRIQLYVVDGQRYGWIPKFETHQRIDKPKPSPLPAPPPRRIQDESKTRRRRVSGGLEGIGLEGNGRDGRGARQESSPTPSAPAPDSLVPAWNEKAHPSLPRVKEFTAGRQKKAKAWFANRTLADWLSGIERINASPFCRGERPRPGHESWCADFDWLLHPDTFPKLMEGKYDDRAQAPPRVNPSNFPDESEARAKTWGEATQARVSNG